MHLVLFLLQLFIIV